MAVCTPIIEDASTAEPFIAHPRTRGATVADCLRATQKTAIAERTIKSLQPVADVKVYPCRWQEHPEPLRACDLIFGCVDGFGERRELEASARRYLIPLIDIGMDVHCVESEPPRMAGQSYSPCRVAHACSASVS